MEPPYTIGTPYGLPYSHSPHARSLCVCTCLCARACVGMCVCMFVFVTNVLVGNLVMNLKENPPLSLRIPSSKLERGFNA